MKRKILLIYTGGTIGMKKNNNYINDSDIFEELINKVKIEIDENVDITIKEINQIIDSSQLTTKVVNEILGIINDNYKNYSGFLIVSGTDTMAYLQSLLKWNIDGCSKPIVLTGSINTADKNSLEGINNIIGSINTISRYDGKYLIGIFMNEKLYRNPTMKFNSCSINPYISNKNSYLEKMRKKYLKASNDFKIYSLKEDLEIEYIHIHPFISIIQGELKDALVIAVYGQGTIINNSSLENRILEYQKKSKPIIIISQSIKNELNINTYSAGEFLKKIHGINASGSFLEESFGCINYLISKNILSL